MLLSLAAILIGHSEQSSPVKVRYDLSTATKHANAKRLQSHKISKIGASRLFVEDVVSLQCESSALIFTSSICTSHGL